MTANNPAKRTPRITPPNNKPQVETIARQMDSGKMQPHAPACIQKTAFAWERAISMLKMGSPYPA